MNRDHLFGLSVYVLAVAVFVFAVSLYVGRVGGGKPQVAVFAGEVGRDEAGAGFVDGYDYYLPYVSNMRIFEHGH